MTFPLPTSNWSYLHTLRLQATTGVNGYTLQDATATVISWTAPDDGNLHRVMIAAGMDITTAPTSGGLVDASYTLPDGTTAAHTLFAASQSNSGENEPSNYYTRIVKAGSTFSVIQESALSEGSAVMWAEIWAL